MIRIDFQSQVCTAVPLNVLLQQVHSRTWTERVSFHTGSFAIANPVKSTWRTWHTSVRKKYTIHLKDSFIAAQLVGMERKEDFPMGKRTVSEFECNFYQNRMIILTFSEDFSEFFQFIWLTGRCVASPGYNEWGSQKCSFRSPSVSLWEKLGCLNVPRSWRLDETMSANTMVLFLQEYNIIVDLLLSLLQYRMDNLRIHHYD